MEKFKGVYEIEFTNGDINTVDIEVNIVNPNAFPIYLKTVDGKFYNWGNIISIKKVIS